MNTTAPHELSDLDFTKLQGQYQAEFGIVMNKQVILLFETQKAAHRQDRNLIQTLYEKQNEDNTTLYQEQIRVLEQKIEQDKQQFNEFIKVMKEGVVAIGKQKGVIITESPAVIAEMSKNTRAKYRIVCYTIFFLSCLGAFIYDRYYERQEEYRKITNTLLNYPNIYKYELLAQDGKILVNPDGKEGEFLELTITPKGELTLAGKNYIYDPKNDRILVPLHFSKKAHAK